MTEHTPFDTPFSADYTEWEDHETGDPIVFIWGSEGEGSGRVATAYEETGNHTAKEMAEFIVTACNDYEHQGKLLNLSRLNVQELEKENADLRAQLDEKELPHG